MTAYLRSLAMLRWVAFGLVFVPLAFAGPSAGTLPRLASTVLPPPDPAATVELDAALGKVFSARADDRETGLRRLHDAGEALLPAMGRKLSELRKTMDRDLVTNLLGEARRRRKTSPHGAENKKNDPSSDLDETAGGDWFAFLSADPKPSDGVYRDTVTVVAIERALVEIGTTAAVRELLNVYVFFGDLFRIDVQHMITRLGDQAVPALLEGRKHDAEKVRRWAARQLDALGKAIPGEAVQIADPRVLADVLRAYGRTKDIDALRVVVSFTASDRAQVRDAAREAVTSYGDAALWQLREAHETLMGGRPAPGASWDKVAADLYSAHDRARLAEVDTLFEEGLDRQKAGDLDAMVERFDRVLARAPTFDRRTEMVAGYSALAQKIASHDPTRSLLLRRKALRLDPDGPTSKALQSRIYTLEGEDLLTRGLADIVPFRRALELDPSNDEARSALNRLEKSTTSAMSPVYRYAAAFVVALVATLAALWMQRGKKLERRDDENSSRPTVP